MCHVSPVTRYLSLVTCHRSPVTCHLSPVTCHQSTTPKSTAIDPLPANCSAMQKLLEHFHDFCHGGFVLEHFRLSESAGTWELCSMTDVILPT